jgi:nucleotide-binding universal stress UspA family protein
MANGDALFLVPLTSSTAAQEALLVAGEAARARHGSVLATFVIEVGHDRPIDAELDAESRRGETVLRRAERAATEHQFKLESDLLQARSAGRAIVDEARRRNAVAIVIGVGAARHGTFDAGGTADYLLRKAPCQVWLIREGAPAE